MQPSQPGEPFAAVGILPGVHEGEILTLTGLWKEHPRFGRQYQVRGWSQVRPATEEGITQYLGSGLIPGIGEAMAQRIVGKFGEKTLEVMDTDLGKLSKVPGIGRKKLEKIREIWNSLKDDREVFLFLQSLGVGPATAQKIHKQYGMETVFLVRENPYRLAEDVWGIGFLRADAIAARIGHARDSHFRIRAALAHLLSKASEDGHTFVSRQALIDSAADLLGIEAHLILFTLDDEIRLQNVSQEEDRVYTPLLFHCEKVLTETLLRLAASPGSPASRLDPAKCIHEFEESRGVCYHALQKEAITRAARDKLLIITGGPGTGKTTTLLGILDYARRAGRTVLLGAPTGRAAKRMEEVARIPAKTIHRLLEYQPNRGFARDADYPLECDLLVIDEVSMVDLPLMTALIRAVPLRASIVLIGDEDQLPSVGPGQVLRDLIESNRFGVVRLTQIFRQAHQSGIIELAHDVRNHRPPAFRNEKESDCFFMEEPDPDKTAHLVADLVLDRLPKAFGFDPLRDIQILVPMHKGLCGAERLNRLIQSRMRNQPEAACTGTMLAGDKVMQIRNNYDKQVFNGDLGLVESLSAEGLIRVRFDVGAVDFAFKLFHERAGKFTGICF